MKIRKSWILTWINQRLVNEISATAACTYGCNSGTTLLATLDLGWLFRAMVVDANIWRFAPLLKWNSSVEILEIILILF